MRVVLFSVSPWLYRLVSRWAHALEHELSLVVTTADADLLAPVPRGQDVLVAHQLPSVARLLTGLEPDLLLSATYPRRIPAEVLDVPRLGALNLHPTALPKGRGPNPARGIYAGEPTMGATLHWMTARLDEGAMLARAEAPVPAAPTAQRLRAVWTRLLRQVLQEGVARAVAGEPGEPQDESAVTYAAPFTANERWLDWAEPAATIQRRVAALSLGDPVALAHLGADRVRVLRANAGAASTSEPPGTVVRRDHQPGESTGSAVVQAADAELMIRYRLLGPAGIADG